MAYPTLPYADTAYLFRLYLEKSMWAGPTLRGDPKGTISKLKLFAFN